MFQAFGLRSSSIYKYGCLTENKMFNMKTTEHTSPISDKQKRQILNKIKYADQPQPVNNSYCNM